MSISSLCISPKIQASRPHDTYRTAFVPPRHPTHQSFPQAFFEALLVVFTGPRRSRTTFVYIAAVRLVDCLASALLLSFFLSFPSSLFISRCSCSSVSTQYHRTSTIHGPTSSQSARATTRRALRLGPLPFESSPIKRFPKGISHNARIKNNRTAANCDSLFRPSPSSLFFPVLPQHPLNSPRPLLFTGQNVTYRQPFSTRSHFRTSPRHRPHSPANARLLSLSFPLSSTSISTSTLNYTHAVPRQNGQRIKALRPAGHQARCVTR